MQKHLVIILWDFDFGGIQTRVESLLKFLSKPTSSDVKVTILLKRSIPNRLSLPKNSAMKVRSFSEDIYSGSQLQFGVWLINQLWQLKPTHILTFSNRFSCLAILYKQLLAVAGKKVRVTISEEIFLSKYVAQYEKSYWVLLISYFYRFADQILVLTAAMKDDLVSSFKIPASNIQVIPSWYEVNSHLIKKQRKQYDLLFVGRLAEEKRVSWLLSLVKQLRKKQIQVQVAIVGEGIQKTILKRITVLNNLEKSIHFVGYKTKAEISHLFLQSSLLVLPSKNEGLPMVILEAAAHQVPVAVASFAGVSEVVESQETGVIFSSQSEFIAEVSKLLRSPKRLQTMGQHAQQKVKNDFSVKNLRLFSEAVLSN